MTDHEPDTTTTPAPEPEPPPEAPAAPRRNLTVPLDGRTLRIAGIVAGAVVALLLILMVFAPGIAPIKLGSSASLAEAEAEKDIETVARRFTSKLYNFDYKTIDADLDAFREDATGGFESELDEFFGGLDNYRDAIVKAQGSSRAEIEGIDVVRVDGDSAVVRAFVSRVITNKNLKEPQSAPDAVEMTFVKTTNGWKVDKVELILVEPPE